MRCAGLAIQRAGVRAHLGAISLSNAQQRPLDIGPRLFARGVLTAFGASQPVNRAAAPFEIHPDDIAFHVATVGRGSSGVFQNNQQLFGVNR